MKRLLDLFRKDSAPRLRNRAGGLAWIKPHGHVYGADVLSGRAVRTVAFDAATKCWQIEPAQTYVVTSPVHCVHSGVTAQTGACVRVNGLSDDVLEPWQDDGITQDEVSALYAPHLTMKATP